MRQKQDTCTKKTLNKAPLNKKFNQLDKKNLLHSNQTLLFRGLFPYAERSSTQHPSYVYPFFLLPFITEVLKTEK